MAKILQVWRRPKLSGRVPDFESLHAHGIIAVLKVAELPLGVPDALSASRRKGYFHVCSAAATDYATPAIEGA